MLHFHKTIYNTKDSDMDTIRVGTEFNHLLSQFSAHHVSIRHEYIIAMKGLTTHYKS